MVSDRGKGAVEVSGGDQEGVALKAPVPVVPGGVFTVEASLLGQGGIGTGERQSLRDGPGGCPDCWPGGARRRGGASLVCGVRMERRRASPDTAAPGGGGERMPASAGCAGAETVAGLAVDRLVVVLILLPGAVERGAKGRLARGFIRLVNQHRWEERHG